VKFMARGWRQGTHGQAEGKMKNEANEYSLAELLDHPGLGWFITSGGIERRCLDLCSMRAAATATMPTPKPVR
jgi:hypothetical protein